MDILDTMRNRHAVRTYLVDPIKEEEKEGLTKFVKEINQESGLHFQLCFEEPKAFGTFLAHYGHFVNVRNYLALVGGKKDEEKVGYYGEKFALLAQEMGLNSCWVALTYGKGKLSVERGPGEKVHAVICFGYGATQGVAHHSKSVEALTDVKGEKPSYWDRAVEACLLAPTAVNQQKFLLSCHDGKPSLKVNGSGFYTKMDLGIVKCHFESATGVKLGD
jgi:hypothetical protein